MPSLSTLWPGRRAWPALAGVLGVLMLGAALVAWTFGPRDSSPSLSKGPGHWEAVAKGRAYLDRGRPDLAVRAVAHVRDEAPGAAEAMTVAGLAQLQRGDLKTARAALERALKLQPHQAVAARALAAICLKTGDAIHGLDYLRLATRCEPEDPRPWLVMGKVQHDLGASREAAAAFAEALRRDPNDPEAQVGLIAELLQSQQVDRAGRALDEARRRRPHDPKLLALAARQALDSARPDAALALADRALERDPDNLDGRLVRAQVFMNRHQADRALADLERAVAISPNDLGALQRLALVEGQLGLSARSAATRARHRAALARAERMDQITQEIAARPHDPEPRCRMGVLAAEGGSTTLAAECFQAALDLDPSYQPARDGLAALRAPRDSAGLARKPSS